MLVVQETTDWKYPNHIYFLTDNRSAMLGYIRAGTDQFIKFKKPIQFDTRGRKFELLRKVESKPKPVENTWNFVGSKGNTYTVVKDPLRLTCTCPGFQFRGQCKHIEQVDKELK